MRSSIEHRGYTITLNNRSTARDRLGYEDDADYQVLTIEPPLDLSGEDSQARLAEMVGAENVQLLACTDLPVSAEYPTGATELRVDPNRSVFRPADTLRALGRQAVEIFGRPLE